MYKTRMPTHFDPFFLAPNVDQLLTDPRLIWPSPRQAVCWRREKLVIYRHFIGEMWFPWVLNVREIDGYIVLKWCLNGKAWLTQKIPIPIFRHIPITEQEVLPIGKTPAHMGVYGVCGFV